MGAKKQGYHQFDLLQLASHLFSEWPIFVGEFGLPDESEEEDDDDDDDDDDNNDNNTNTDGNNKVTRWW